MFVRLGLFGLTADAWVGGTVSAPQKFKLPQSWGTSWDEKICKQNLSTILISRDRAVCLQFGAKIRINIGDLKRVSGEFFFISYH